MDSIGMPRWLRMVLVAGVVVRGDVGDLSQAQAVIVVAHAVALLIAPPGSSTTKITDLKRSVVGCSEAKPIGKSYGS
jgi:hypothetical protein